jgi:preprotein translocase subunit YajC
MNTSGMAALALMALPANALAQAEPPAGGGLGAFIPLILIMVIFYFLLIRPQQKRAKEHNQFISSLKKGDKVITGGGIYGTIQDVQEDSVKLDIAKDVRIKIKRDTISGLAD